MPIEEARRATKTPPPRTICHPPPKHRHELGVIAREMQDRAADDDVGKAFRERERLEWLDTEIFCRELWGVPCGQAVNLGNGIGVLVRPERLVAGAKEIDQVAAVAATGVEHGIARGDATAERLVEQIDVELTELIRQISHGAQRTESTYSSSASVSPRQYRDSISSISSSLRPK